MLNQAQEERYARQVALPDIGRAGQEALAAARVLVVGMGGLGSPVALYLAAAGVGCLGLMDGDQVDLTNLQRQILHRSRDVGSPKTNSAARTLTELNPDVQLHLLPERLTPANAALVAEYDMVVDATDSPAAACLIADSCHTYRVPYCHGGIERFRGQVMTVDPGRTTCVRCVFEDLPQEPDAASPSAGPVGALAGIIGSIQAMDVLNVLLSIGQPLFNSLLTFDALTLACRRIIVRRRPDCPLCGNLSHASQLEPGRVKSRMKEQ